MNNCVYCREPYVAGALCMNRGLYQQCIPAQGTPEPPTLYVISVTGDGGQTTVVPESQLKTAVHEAYCSCGKEWQKCTDEVVTNTIATLDDDTAWTKNYPAYERHIWTDHGEDYTVQVMRTTSTLPLSALAGPQNGQGWVSIKDRLPETSGVYEVIIAHAGKEEYRDGASFDLRCEDEWTFSSDPYHGMMDLEVSHWRKFGSLPAPPTGDAPTEKK